MKKFFVCVVCFFVVMFCYKNYAGTFMKNEFGWYFVKENADKAKNEWILYDYDNDGYYEYYHFNEFSLLDMDKKLEDGKEVNKDGQWVVKGLIKTKKVESGILENFDATKITIDEPDDHGVVIAPYKAYSEYTETQTAAILKAKEIYVNIPCSKIQLIELLEKEGFNHSDAFTGAEWCGANWHHQAYRRALELYTQGVEKKLIDAKLDSEGYLERQISNAIIELDKYIERSSK